MERIIRVTGRGKIAVKPDTIRLNIILEDQRETYEETLKQSTIQTEALKDCFENLDFDRSDLKTAYFNVDTEYESYQDKSKNWKQRFMGYHISRSLRTFGR